MRGVAAIAGARCLGCGLRGQLLCAACVEELPPPSVDGPIPGVDRLLVPCSYGGLARRLILDLKVRGLRTAAEPLVAAMNRQILAQGLRGQVLTWVPGRRRDIRRRGFDHAEVLARGLARRLYLDARPYLFRRARTPDQTSLGAVDRRLNAAASFAPLPCLSQVVIVDDLVTTGATAAACASALRSSGARHIELLAPCRA